MIEHNHCDILGVPLSIGDYVAAPFPRNTLRVCKIVEFTPEQLRVKDYSPNSKYFNEYRGYLRTPNDVRLLSGEELTIWILKNDN